MYGPSCPEISATCTGNRFKKSAMCENLKTFVSSEISKFFL